MDKNKIVELLQKLVQREVSKQVSLMKLQIMSEVAGMLQYSERAMLVRLDERDSGGKGRVSDFERSMNNLDTMPAYRQNVAPRPNRVAATRPPMKKRYTGDSALNDLLNDTGAFSRDELSNEGASMQDVSSLITFGGNRQEPWGKFAPPTMDSEPAVRVKRPFAPVDTDSVPTSITGTDGKPVDLTNETVQNVLDIISNTNYADKLKRMNEAGAKFRETLPERMTAAPIPADGE